MKLQPPHTSLRRFQITLQITFPKQKKTNIKIEKQKTNNKLQKKKKQSTKNKAQIKTRKNTQKTHATTKTR